MTDCVTVAPAFTFTPSSPSSSATNTTTIVPVASAATSASRLVYSKEFLLQFATINKREPLIVEKLSPYVSPSRPKKAAGAGARGKRFDPPGSPAPSLSDSHAQSRTPNPKKSFQPAYMNVPQTEVKKPGPPLHRPPASPIAFKGSVPLLGIQSQGYQKENIPVVNAAPMGTGAAPSSRKALFLSPIKAPPPSSSAASLAIGTDAIPLSPSKPINSPPTSPRYQPKTPNRALFASTPVKSSVLPPLVPLITTSAPLSFSGPDPTPSSPRVSFASLSSSHYPSTPLSKIGPLSPVRNLASPPRLNSTSPQRTPKSPARPISPLDEQRLLQRQKQIDYGYRTVGYVRYRLLVPKDQRKPEYPRTPKKNQGCSKRSWDGQLKKWRRDLHCWDPESIETFRVVLESDLVKNIIKSYPELEEVVRIVKDKIDNPSADDKEEEKDEEKEEEEDTQRDEEEEEVSPSPEPLVDDQPLLITIQIPDIQSPQRDPIDASSNSNTPPDVERTSSTNINSNLSHKSTEKKISPSRINDPRMNKVARTLIF